MIGAIFGAVGDVVSTSMSIEAQAAAQQMQLAALAQARKYLYENLDPAVIGPQALQGDINNAINRLRLQGQIDPGSLQARYASQAAILRQMDALGGGSAGAVGDAAAREALGSTAEIDAVKQRLLDAANVELSAGATLPPDVQAELMKAGLERSGMVTGTASGRGTGGQILRTILGSAGLNLKRQRQETATGLVTAAQNLTASRAQILQNLFPTLSAAQLQNLQATQGVLTQSNSMVPNAGLSGTDVANLWLARVGATNANLQQAAEVRAQGALAQGAAYANLAGGLANTAGTIANNYSNGNGWGTSSGPAFGSTYTGYGGASYMSVPNAYGGGMSVPVT